MNRAWIITLASAAAFVGAAFPMAKRIGNFNTNAHYTRYHAETIIARQTRLQGFPLLKVDDLPGEGESKNSYFLKLTYGEPVPEESSAPAPITKLVAVHRPPAPNMPRLDIYEEWAKLLAINEVERDAVGNPHSRPGSERLMLIIRRTPEGFDADTWGSVRRTEWLFDFHDFNPDGTITTETRRWPMANPMYERAFVERAESAARAIPPDTRLKSISDMPPLAERSIEYFAAMHTIPRLNVPKYKFSDTAFSFRTLSWTLPVVMLAGLTFSIAIFFAVASNIRRRPKRA